MKANELSKKCETYIEDLISQIKEDSATVTRYLDFCSRFHTYSFRNKLLIWKARRNATRVAGFSAWQKLGRFVKKGEKGIPIFAPMRIKNIEDNEDGSAEQTEQRIFFRVVYVWDVAQTEGDALPDAPDTLCVTGTSRDILPAMENLVRSRGITLQYADISKACGTSQMGKIVVRASMNENEKFSVLAHELTHEILHTREERRALKEKVKEAEAEASAYTVCRHFGLETKAPSYLALYKVEEVDVRASLGRIVQTASTIIQGVTKQIPALKRAA
ncbi:MAG: ArdC-like ssDNA-binding domain-containing protein [Desulfobacteria bacterium]